MAGILVTRRDTPTQVKCVRQTGSRSDTPAVYTLQATGLRTPDGVDQTVEVAVGDALGGPERQ